MKKMQVKCKVGVLVWCIPRFQHKTCLDLVTLRLMLWKWNGEQMEADETRETPAVPAFISRLRQSAVHAASRKSNQKSITGRVTVSHAQMKFRPFGPEKKKKTPFCKLSLEFDEQSAINQCHPL